MPSLLDPSAERTSNRGAIIYCNTLNRMTSINFDAAAQTIAARVPHQHTDPSTRNRRRMHSRRHIRCKLIISQVGQRHLLCRNLLGLVASYSSFLLFIISARPLWRMSRRRWIRVPMNAIGRTGPIGRVHVRRRITLQILRRRLGLRRCGGVAHRSSGRCRYPRAVSVPRCSICSRSRTRVLLDKGGFTGPIREGSRAGPRIVR